MNRVLYWWWRLTDPQGLQRYQARQAAIVNLEFWQAECVRIHHQIGHAKTCKEMFRLMRQYEIAARRFDKEYAKMP